MKYLLAILGILCLIIIVPAGATHLSCDWNHGKCVDACKAFPGPYGCDGLSPAKRANCCAAADQELRLAIGWR